MAGKIPQSFIDDLLERIDIVDVIDPRTKLKKTGKNYMACCPFHDEKTPSFSVSPDKQLYHCFGCGASGNSLGFIMEYDRQSFPDAVETLAKLAGVSVPREQVSPAQQAKEQQRQSLFSVLESIGEYYQTQLIEHPKKTTATGYLKRRGLSGSIARDFSIGYAPPGWSNLLDYLKAQSVSSAVAVDSGAVIYSEDKNRHYDRFRERIIFPIRNTKGQTIGFGGRVLNDDKPKYLNSPETSVFHKGRELYGLYEARQAHKELPRLLVVEGYMDVVALAQFGIRYGVATLGTACGEEHLARAFRYTSEIVFCFDGDQAGRKAAIRAMEHSLPAMEDGRQIRFLYLPEGEDPDSLVRQVGAEKFTRLIEAAPPLEYFLFDELAQGLDVQTMEGRARLCKLALPHLDKLPKGVYRELMFGQLAKRTQLSMNALMRLLEEDEQLSQPFSSVDPSPAFAEPPVADNTHYEGLPPSSYDEPPADYEDYDHISDDSGELGANSVDGGVAEHYYSRQVSIPVKSVKAGASGPEALAITLLLYQPALGGELSVDDLANYGHGFVPLLVKLVRLINERPHFTSGQILGHWQGAYGVESARLLEAFMERANERYKADSLCAQDVESAPERAFNAKLELDDALAQIRKRLAQSAASQVIMELEQKPREQWSEDEKSQYRQAFAAQNDRH